MWKNDQRKNAGMEARVGKMKSAKHALRVEWVEEFPAPWKCKAAKR